jgi:D-beta-D-heptose 7-phosphate kinase/D-beta-D-heptose 1-phosphate adenosyltransferase
MAIFSSGDRQVMLIPTYAREVYDVSGAGDTVISVLALAMAGGASVEEAAILGNLAAGVEVGKRGTATVTPDEVEVALEFFGAMGISGSVS